MKYGCVVKSIAPNLFINTPPPTLPIPWSQKIVFTIKACFFLLPLPSSSWSCAGPFWSFGSADPRSSSQGEDKLTEVQQKLDTASGVMQQNVGIMLTNLDKANALERGTEELAQSANQCVGHMTAHRHEL